MPDQRQTAPPPEGYVSSREAAAMLHVSVGTVLNLVERGTLKAWRTAGGHRRIGRDSVRALLASRQNALANKPRAFKILIVEDDEQMRDIYRLQFESWGLATEVRIAESGVEGLVEIGRDMPNLLILDLMMPNVDGFAVLRDVSRLSVRRGMDILVISGLSQDAIEKAGGLPPGVIFWPKPLQFAQLRGFVEGCLTARPPLFRD